MFFQFVRRLALLLPVLAQLLPAPALALDELSWQASLGITTTKDQARSGGLFRIAAQPAETSPALTLSASTAAVTLDAKLARNRWQLTQAYGEFAIGDWDWLVGRRYLGWDPSYGLRPLDLFGQEAARGADLLLAERFTDWGSVSLACSPKAQAGHDMTSGQPLCAVRAYRYAGALESQLVAYWPGRGAGLGIGASYVPRDWLELHLGAIYQRRYRRLQQSPAGDLAEPWVTNGVMATVGSNFTWLGKLQTVVEWQYSDQGFTEREWQQLRRTAREREQLAPGYGMSLADAYRLPTLSRQSWLVHSYVELTGRLANLQPSLSAQFVPADNSVMWQPELTINATPRLTFSLWLRQFSGSAESVYGQLPLARQWQFSMEYLLDG